MGGCCDWSVLVSCVVLNLLVWIGYTCLLFGVFLSVWFAFWWCLLHSAVFCWFTLARWVVGCFVICWLVLVCGVWCCGCVFRWSGVVSVFSLYFLVSVWYGIVACVYTWVLLCGLVSRGFDLLVDLSLLIVVGKWC